MTISRTIIKLKIVLILILLLTSCFRGEENNKGSVVKFHEFKREIGDLKTKSRHNLNRFMSNPTMKLIGDYLVFYDVHYDRGELMDVYSKSEFEYLGSLVTLGGGAGEISNPGFIAPGLDGSSVWVSDNGKSQLVRYDLKEVNLNSTVKWKEVVKYPDNISIMMNFHPLGENIFISQTFDYTDSLLMRFGKGMKEHLGYGYPSEDPIIIGDAFMQFGNVFCYLPNGNVALTYRHYDALQIFDKEGNKLSTTIGPDNISITSPKDVLATYRHTKASKNFIYAEYVGDVPVDWNSNSMNLATSLYIFNLKGDPMAELNTGVSIANFALDPETKSLWVYTNDTEDNPVLRFDFDESVL